MLPRSKSSTKTSLSRPGRLSTGKIESGQFNSSSVPRPIHESSQHTTSQKSLYIKRERPRSALRPISFPLFNKTAHNSHADHWPTPCGSQTLENNSSMYKSYNNVSERPLVSQASMRKTQKVVLHSSKRSSKRQVHGDFRNSLPPNLLKQMSLASSDLVSAHGKGIEIYQRSSLTPSSPTACTSFKKRFLTPSERMEETNRLLVENIEHDLAISHLIRVDNQGSASRKSNRQFFEGDIFRERGIAIQTEPSFNDPHSVKSLSGSTILKVSNPPQKKASGKDNSKERKEKELQEVRMRMALFKSLVEINTNTPTIAPSVAKRQALNSEESGGCSMNQEKAQKESDFFYSALRPQQKKKIIKTLVLRKKAPEITRTSEMGISRINPVKDMSKQENECFVLGSDKTRGTRALNSREIKTRILRLAEKPLDWSFSLSGARESVLEKELAMQQGRTDTIEGWDLDASKRSSPSHSERF